MEWYPSITKTFLQPPLFQHRALARCWFRREKARMERQTGHIKLHDAFEWQARVVFRRVRGLTNWCWEKDARIVNPVMICQFLKAYAPGLSECHWLCGTMTRMTLCYFWPIQRLGTCMTCQKSGSCREFCEAIAAGQLMHSVRPGCGSYNPVPVHAPCFLLY